MIVALAVDPDQKSIGHACPLGPANGLFVKPNHRFGRTERLTIIIIS